MPQTYKKLCMFWKSKKHKTKCSKWLINSSPSHCIFSACLSFQNCTLVYISNVLKHRERPASCLAFFLLLKHTQCLEHSFRLFLFFFHYHQNTKKNYYWFRMNLTECLPQHTINAAKVIVSIFFKEVYKCAWCDGFKREN